MQQGICLPRLNRYAANHADFGPGAYTPGGDGPMHPISLPTGNVGFDPITHARTLMQLGARAHRFEACLPACMHACMHACVFVCMYVCMHACMLYVKLAGSARGGTATPSGISRLTGQHGGGPKSVRLVSAGCGLAGSARARASRVPAHLGSHRRMRFAPRRRRPSIRKRR